MCVIVPRGRELQRRLCIRQRGTVSELVTCLVDDKRNRLGEVAGVGSTLLRTCSGRIVAFTNEGGFPIFCSALVVKGQTVPLVLNSC